MHDWEQEQNVRQKGPTIVHKGSRKFLITNIQENYADETKAVKELISAQKRIIFMTSAYHIYRTKKLFAK